MDSGENGSSHTFEEVQRQCSERRRLIDTLAAEEENLIRAIRKKKLVYLQEEQQLLTDAHALQRIHAGLTRELAVLNGRADQQTQELRIALGKVQAEKLAVDRLKEEQSSLLGVIDLQEKQLVELRRKVLMYSQSLRDQHHAVGSSPSKPSDGQRHARVDGATEDADQSNGSDSAKDVGLVSERDVADEDIKAPSEFASSTAGKDGPPSTSTDASRPRDVEDSNAADGIPERKRSKGDTVQKRSGSSIVRGSSKQRRQAEDAIGEQGDGGGRSKSGRSKRSVSSKKKKGKKDRSIATSGKQGSLEGPEGGGALIAAMEQKITGEEPSPAEKRRTLRAKVARARKASIRNLNRFRKRDGKSGAATSRDEDAGQSTTTAQQPQFRTIYRRKTAQHQGLVDPQYAPSQRRQRRSGGNYNLHRLRSPKVDAEDDGYHSAPEDPYKGDRDRITPRQREAIHTIQTSKAVSGRSKRRSRRRRDRTGRGQERTNHRRGFSRDW